MHIDSTHPNPTPRKPCGASLKPPNVWYLHPPNRYPSRPIRLSSVKQTLRNFANKLARSERSKNNKSVQCTILSHPASLNPSFFLTSQDTGLLLQKCRPLQPLRQRRGSSSVLHHRSPRHRSHRIPLLDSLRQFRIAFVTYERPALFIADVVVGSVGLVAVFDKGFGVVEIAVDGLDGVCYAGFLLVVLVIDGPEEGGDEVHGGIEGREMRIVEQWNAYLPDSLA